MMNDSPKAWNYIEMWSLSTVIAYKDQDWTLGVGWQLSQLEKMFHLRMWHSKKAGSFLSQMFTITAL
jgi:hypothetical protein